jgi:hypothetical protein
MDVSGILVGQHLLGKRRHVVRRLAQEGDERFHRQRNLRQRRRRIVEAAALPGAAVAFEAPIREIKAPLTGSPAGTSSARAVAMPPTAKAAAIAATAPMRITD